MTMGKPPDWLDIASIFSTVGVQGELKIRPDTDDPLRLKELPTVSALLATGARETLEVERVTLRKDGTVIAKFKGFDAPETAARLRQARLQVPFAEAKRKPGQVLYADVLGLVAVDDETSAPLGVVTEVLRAGQDILEIRTEAGDEVMVPWVDAFVVRVDLVARQIRLKPIEGLFE